LYYYTEYDFTHQLKILFLDTLKNLQAEFYANEVLREYNYAILNIGNREKTGYVDIRSRQFIWFENKINELGFFALGKYPVIDVISFNTSEFTFVTHKKICSYLIERDSVRIITYLPPFPLFRYDEERIMMNYYEILTNSGEKYLYSINQQKIIYKIIPDWYTKKDPHNFDIRSIGFSEYGNNLFMYPIYFAVETDK
jgi:hypothetical protein